MLRRAGPLMGSESGEFGAEKWAAHFKFKILTSLALHACPADPMRPSSCTSRGAKIVPFSAPGPREWSAPVWDLCASYPLLLGSLRGRNCLRALQWSREAPSSSL